MRPRLQHRRWPLATAIVLASVFVVGIFLVPKRLQSSAITSVAISANGHWLAAGTRDGRVKICALTTSAQCRTVPSGGSELNDLQFSRDERFLAIADDNLRLVSVDTQNKSSLLRNDKLVYGTVRFDSSGNRLLTIDSQGRVEVINLHSKMISATICCSSFYGEVAFLSSDTQIVNAGHWPRVWTEAGKLIDDLASYRQIETLRPIVADEPSRRIFMGSQDGRVYAWSLTDFSFICKSPAEADYVDTMALVRGLGLLAYCSFGKHVHLWKPETSETPKTVAANSSSNVVALPDEISIAFGTTSGAIQIWNLKPSAHLTADFKIFAK